MSAAHTLRAKQAPIKETYRTDPSSALVTLSSTGSLSASSITCKLSTGAAAQQASSRVAGLHPKAGGSDPLISGELCSGDMLLEALVACAGVTLRAVATSMRLDVTGTVHAEGDLDFRGTLGVDKQAPVGFRDIRLTFDLTIDADADQLAGLIKLTERYCVVLQTIRRSPTTSVHVTT